MEIKKKKKHSIKIFVDFDGTITKKDVGNEIFKKFGKFEPYHSKLIKDEISIFQYWHSVCNSFSKKINEELIKDFVLEFEVDQYFFDFVNYCRISKIPLSIVSDGFYLYIKTILDNAGLNCVPIYCNYLSIENGFSVLNFPYASESCTCKCASCKRNVILTNISGEDLIIFIGDGYSDFCAAEHSDIVFAKGALATYCNANKIPHYPFSTFFDVKRLLKIIIEKNKLSIRHQAKLKRIKAFETE
jgi:2-hydroxy-3-keto-5-methylthiopentenyl-1-phosphate phosphatase